jgi:ribosomal protein L11 methyltransferase
MAWLAIKLHAEAHTAEAVADALIEAGALSVSCDDADAGTDAEASQFAEPGQDPPRPWQRNILTALVAEDASAESIVAAAALSCGITAPSFSVALVDDEDWVRRTQLQFEPMRIADRLWIVPSWCVPPEPTATNIAIDPGLAFGTGSHPTTRLMLRWLVSHLKGGESLLDYGCGSGILAIVAARLGAQRVVGVDIDPQAILTAKENAAKNGVAVRFFAPEAIPEGPSDIVVANILANPLIVLAPLIAAHCVDQVALSGILEDQFEEIKRAYSAEFELEVADRDEGWILVSGDRR